MMTNRETTLQDFTSYRITQIEPLRMEEVGLASKVCLYSGSTYIDISFRRLLKNHLSSTYSKGQVITEKHLDKAEQMFAVAEKADFTLKDKGSLPRSWEVSENPDDFEDGEIDVPW